MRYLRQFISLVILCVIVHVHWKALLKKIICRLFKTSRRYVVGKKWRKKRRRTKQNEEWARARSCRGLWKSDKTSHFEEGKIYWLLISEVVSHDCFALFLSEPVLRRKVLEGWWKRAKLLISLCPEYRRGRHRLQHQGTIKCASLMTQHCQLGSTSFLKVLSPTKGTTGGN